jgi:hypothetical protein
VDTIRRQCIGVSAHQKLELLTSLARLCGYESVAVFGDCFDEVSRVIEGQSSSQLESYFSPLSCER